MKSIFLTLGWLAIVTSGYNALPEQTDDTPFETASGKRVRECTIAVSPKLESKGFTLGSLVFITGKIKYLEHCKGYFEITDRTSQNLERIPDLRADLFFWPKWQAIEFGKNYYIHLIKKIGEKNGHEENSQRPTRRIL